MPTIDEQPLYHGVRASLQPGDEVAVSDGYALCSPDLDAAIWSAELADGEDEPRVYRVRLQGEVEDVSSSGGTAQPPHPAMTWRTRAPLVVVNEVREWRHYHGTKATLSVGEHLEPGHAANFGATPRTANFVYFTRTLDASIWGAELALGEGPGHIYIVEPTGPFEDDPNLTNARFRGNPTKSFRTRAPLRIVGEHTGWTGHPPEIVHAMKEGLARKAREGIEPDDG